MRKFGVRFWALGVIFSFAFFAFFVASGAVLARIGVGVGVGKIIVDQPLKPGIIYTFPPIIVINTGDEPAEYTTSVQYHSGQETNPDMGLKPPAEWFVFEPAIFSLEPGKSKSVEVTVSLPLKAPPGKYFAYLEAQPVQRAEGGITLIRVAAAAKLWFTVVPANWWMGVYYRLASLYAIYGVWVRLVVGVVIFAVLLTLFRRFFAFNIQLKRPSKQESSEGIAKPKAKAKVK